MDELRNLQQMYSLAAGRFNQYEGKDFILPQVFKDEVKEINTNSITYNEYSAVIETKGTQTGVLNIYLPNQWFYIASYFTDFFNELQKYKRYALKVFSKDRLKELNGLELTAEEEIHISRLELSDRSKSYLKRFVTDYAWWYGAKTIDRGDFYVSPILSSARLVNASQSFVADLCAFLSDKKHLVDAIIKGEECLSSVELLRQKAAATFLKKAMFITIEQDANLACLESLNMYSKTSVLLKINGFPLGRDFEQLPNRMDDVDVNVLWVYDDKKYVLYLEWTPEMMESQFFPMFNKAYQGVLRMEKDVTGEYVLYQEKKIKASAKILKTSPLQQIFYGAPGTGKSFEICCLTKGKEVIRTTFHPDSDYSTFVGAYKPTSIEVPVRDVTGKVIIEDGKKVTENRIVYEFVEQAFLQAYIKAWKAYAAVEAVEKPTDQYLIIEEINRGNCAQIFGDLFQLLDRNSAGFSDYPITADKDMKKQLAKAFKGLTIADTERINAIYDKDVINGVISGEILLLPDNLYIWATMNTSDQSLFPIDSAFKRRWDWKYVPICEGVNERGERLGFKLKVAGKEYDWWNFLEKINNEIDEQTKSEDKKLGYFFCKAHNGVIDAETFVSKVVFYLWNDVFKDQDVTSIFNDGDEELTFSKFYFTDNLGRPVVNEDKVEVFLSNLGLKPIEDVSVEADTINEQTAE
ncbi:AAA family ATPase [Prevotella sp. RM4]|uniref:AAA family ATPase n=1 Tax=Prevotella sp. RM4 TaxID=1200547 RepID=UPI00068D178B|nr:AAA family ATPase [Prevotella sp. RM4]